MAKKKWLLSIVLLLAAILVFAGCSSDNAKNSNDGNKGANTDTKSPDTNDLTPITYTMGTASTKLTWDTPINKAMTEKTGVSIDYVDIVGDMFQKWDIWLASGDYPDIIRLDALHLQKYIEGGAVIPLEDLIDQYGPNIKEKFGDKFEMLRHDDGHIYSLYSVNVAEEAPADTKGTYIVQMKMLKDEGYPEIKTLDQLYDLIADYKAKNPQSNGQDTIGFGGAMESFMIKMLVNNSTISSQGLPDHGNFYFDGDNAIWNPPSDQSKRYYQFLHKLILNDLFDIEAFSMTLEAMQTKLAQGRVLAAYAPGWIVDGANSALRADGKEELMYASLPILFDEDIVDRSISKTPTNAGTHEWAISKKAKNPERIIQFIDFLFSDEGQVLSQWGIEGTHYEVVDGHRVVTDAWLEEKSADADALYKAGFKSEGTGGSSEWFGLDDGAKLADGDYATPLTKDLVRRQYTETEKETLAQYGAETWSDLLPPAVQVPGYLWQLTPPEDMKVIEQRLDELWRKSTPEILLTKSEADFEAKWNDFVKKAEDIGVDKYNAAYTKIWQNYISE